MSFALFLLNASFPQHIFFLRAYNRQKQEQRAKGRTWRVGSACLALGREARNACVISNVLQVITILPWLREIVNLGFREGS